MPNWCANTIIISDYSEEKITDLYNKIISWKDNPNNETRNYIGDIIINSCITDTTDLNEISKSYNSRGTINDIYINGTSIYIDTDSAWSPSIKMWKDIIDMYLPSATLEFLASEPGECIWITNREVIAGHYILDVWDDIDDEHISDYMDNVEPEDLRTYLQEILHTDEEDIPELIAMVEDNEELSDKMSINQWDYGYIEDCY